jgi:hypothetical protein
MSFLKPRSWSFDDERSTRVANDIIHGGNSVCVLEVESEQIKKDKDEETDSASS